MKSKLMFLQDLYKFCEQNNFSYFNSKDSNYVLSVQIPANFSADKSSGGSLDGMYPVVLNACHDKQNLNGSGISKENMSTALPSFQLRPILAEIKEKEDGSWDFGTHAMEIVPDPFNEGEERFHYIERPVGVIYGDVSLVYDEESDVDRVVAHGYLYNDYGNGAVEILQQRGEASCSVELCIREMSYNAKDKYLDITDFYFNGVTILGADVAPGMAGSNIKLEDFAKKEENAFNFEKELIEALDKLNDGLSSFNKVLAEEGGNESVKLSELLEKYSVTLEDLPFEVEGLSNEELETKFAEAYEASDDVDPASDDEGDDDSEDAELEVIEEEAKKKKRKKCSLDEEGNMILAYKISHEDIRCALYRLLENYEEADDTYYYINSVYDDYMVYSDWAESKIYRHNYSVDGDNVTLADERTQLFKEYLTTSEKATLDEMRSNYSTLKTKVAEYEASEKIAKADEIFTNEAYSAIAESEEFKELQNKVSDYSLEEIQDKADILLAKHIKAGGQFSLEKPETKPGKVGFDFNRKKERKAYGNLFKNKN